MPQNNAMPQMKYVALVLVLLYAGYAMTRADKQAETEFDETSIPEEGTKSARVS
jgi:hypothetical protein